MSERRLWKVVCTVGSTASGIADLRWWWPLFDHECGEEWAVDRGVEGDSPMVARKSHSVSLVW